MSSLIAEITWNRMLVLIIGNTVMATSFLLVAFMGGLGLGSFWGSRYFSQVRRTSSLLPYCILEGCIGIYIVSSPLFFQPVSNLFSSLAPLISESAILYIARFLVAFGCLFFPAFMMGATFPAIISGSALKDSQNRVSRTGYLYTINTFGAAAGCLGAGYLLLPKIGVQLTLVVAFFFNIIAAAGALVLYNLQGKASSELSAISNLKSEITASNQQSQSSSFLHLVGIATFIIGFIALAYEVLLTRLVILFFGNQLIVFTLVLTAFLLGTGISAFIGTAIYRYIKNTGLLFGIIIIAVGIFIIIPPFLFVSLSASEKTWLILNRTFLVGMIMLVPVFFIGGLLPLAIRIFENQASGVREQGSEGGKQKTEKWQTVFNAGKLYAFNTCGGMLGAGITNYFLVPNIGTQETLTLFSIICLAIGLAVLWLSRKSVLRWSLAAISVFALSAFVITLPHKLGELYTSKLARVSGGDIEPDLKLHYEGRVATITIIDFPWLGFRDMFLNGVEEASTRFSHVQLFKLLGLLPVLAHESDDPKEALMIAFGAGIAAGAALDSNQVSSLDVVDLNPDIKKINDLFKEVNGDVFQDSRFNFISEDGRNYLLMNPKKYSVIMSDSTHPRAYDSWILYTKEFYEDIKDHLLPGGIFAQWIPLSDFSLEMYKIMLSTFKSVFQNVTLWNIYGTDQAFLLATPSPLSLNMARLQNQLDSVSASLLLKKYQMDKAVDFAGFFVMDNKTIEKFIGDEKRVNTDNLPYNQKYSLKKNSPLRTKSFDQYQASIRSYLKEVSEEDLAAIDKRQVVARNMYRYFFFADQAALDGALAIRPIDGNVLHYKNLERQMEKMASEKLRVEENSLRENIKVLQQKIKETPTGGKNYSQLAKIYLDLGLIDNAETLLRKALKYSPKSAKAHELMGLAQANKRNWKEAEYMFQYALMKDPEDNYIMDNLIRIYAEQNQHEKAANILLKKINKKKKTEREELGSYQDDVSIAGSYFSLKDYKNTEKFLLSALDKYPGNTVALFYLAHVYRETKRMEEAIEQLNRILEINPFNSPAKQLLKEFQKLNNSK
tara:strand:+ start:2296 stop:5478 length:3183 start_codon:yes stop_codon:yes gene_type:complete